MKIGSSVFSFAPGETKAVELILTNNGDGENFNILATDNLGLITTPVPFSIFVATGISKTVPITLSIPVTMPENMVINFSATAAKVGSDGVFNSDARTYPVLNPGTVLIVTPDTLTFNVSASKPNPTPQSFTIDLNKGESVWNASSDVDWLTINTLTGTGDSVIDIAINSTTLRSGTYTGKVQIVADDRVIVRAVVLNIEGSSTYLPLIRH